MKITAPDYYNEFRCIANKCTHTCCKGWEIAIDSEKLEIYMQDSEIAPHVEPGVEPHIKLLEGEACPFLNEEGLCRLILTRGEDVLCDICRDHPRFRNFWEDRTELGLGLVCEEAARIILIREKPMELIVLSDDGEYIPQPEDEKWLFEFRSRLLNNIDEKGPRARLLEYLIYRHIPDALYDNRLEERAAFIEESFRQITAEWDKTDGSMEALAECARSWSYAVEYDDEELEKRISAFEK